jgi:hypothetical protein
MVHNARVTIAKAGRAVPLGPAGGPRMVLLWIEAPEANTSPVCVGGASVVALVDSYNSPELQPGDRMWLNNVDIGDVWVDARTDDDVVVWRGMSA